MNIKTSCNQSLPTNAVSVTDLAPGMSIRAPYSGGGGIVADVQDYYFQGRVKVIFTDGSEVRASKAGTFRMDPAPEGYNYHTGHGCPKDV